MQLLAAVNLILPKLGERPVTSLSTKHPTLAVLMPIIEQVRLDVLREGYWFNEYSYTIPLSPTKELELGTQTLRFIPDEVDKAVQRGNKLFNPKTLSFVFDAPLKGTVTQDVPFDELPDSAATFVFYSSLVLAYATDIGATQELQLWQNMAQSAASNMLSEHLKQKRYNTRRSRNWGKLRSAMRS